METLLTRQLLRLNQILAPGGPIPVSKSTWYQKVRTGEYPAPVKISARVTAWKPADILELLKTFEEQSNV